MKYILYFIITLLVSFNTTTYSQDKLLTFPHFVIKNPTLNFDPTLELMALRYAHFIEVENEHILFMSKDEKYKEGYDLKLQSQSIKDNCNRMRFNFLRGPFRWLQIEYKAVDEQRFECTLQFFDLSGEIIYSAHTDHLIFDSSPTVKKEKNRVK
ncbi:hypothetical protein [Flammeovirga sp. OC4]|uniref:hypothetical protein n=1 Tax=Flammeovirga sp. OC4 TaxID=1382345 RepID=UPI0005C5FAC8|nr:hypothetical protein [Flammeovirga sp. OC4]